MKNRIITISRESGSGGHTIGKKVAEKLGIPCYDSEVIHKLAKESGFSEKYVEEAGECAPKGLMEQVWSHRVMGPTNEDYIWKMQQEIIKDLAKKGPCVIVGRCADYILDDEADCLKVFIRADLKFRTDRVMKETGATRALTEGRLKNLDKRRTIYYRFYTDKKWGVADNYHLCLDSGALGIDKCVDIIASVY